MRIAAVGVVIVAAVLQVACDKPEDESSRQAAGGGCVGTGNQAERRAVIEFFAAYNDGDVGKAERVSELTELWDPVGTAFNQPIRPDLPIWVASGRRVNDEISVIDVCVYRGQGAEGDILRRSDVLRSAGMPSLTQSFKARTDGRVLRQLVLYPPMGDAGKQFCAVFGAVARAAANADGAEGGPCPA